MNELAQTQEQQQQPEIETPQIRSWKYTISQTSKGARITVHGDDISDLVDDYAIIRSELASRGYKIAPED